MYHAKADNGEYRLKAANQKSMAHKWHNFSVHVFCPFPSRHGAELRSVTGYYDAGALRFELM
jgi:hypothetical protein